MADDLESVNATADTEIPIVSTAGIDQCINPTPAVVNCAASEECCANGAVEPVVQRSAAYICRCDGAEATGAVAVV